MRHRKKTNFGRSTREQNKAVLRALLTSFFECGKIKTTLPRARFVQKSAENLIAKIKNKAEKFNAIREIKKILFTEAAQKKAFEISEKFSKKSGFTRVLKLPPRVGDGAAMAQIEFCAG